MLGNFNLENLSKRLVPLSAVAVCVLAHNPSVKGASTEVEFTRLFTTVEERSYLDNLRANKVTKPVAKKRKPINSEKPQVLSYKGVLSVSNGKPVLFVETTSDDVSHQIKHHPVSDNRHVVSVSDQLGREIASLKPGQSYAVDSGKYADYFDARPAKKKQSKADFFKDGSDPQLSK